MSYKQSVELANSVEKSNCQNSDHWISELSLIYIPKSEVSKGWIFQKANCCKLELLEIVEIAKCLKGDYLESKYAISLALNALVYEILNIAIYVVFI